MLLVPFVSLTLLLQPTLNPFDLYQLEIQQQQAAEREAKALRQAQIAQADRSLRLFISHFNLWLKQHGPNSISVEDVRGWKSLQKEFKELNREFREIGY